MKDSQETKRTAPVPSVGADGEQPISQKRTSSIAEKAPESNPQEKRLEELMRQVQRMNDPAYLPTVSMNELYESVYQCRPPVIDGLLYPGTYLFAGAPKVGKSFLMAVQFSEDPEQALPEAGPLESARAYREKKVKPLWEKIVKVLRSVYRAYFDLKSKFERLQGQYNRVSERCYSFSARLDAVSAENKALREEVMDYERLKQAIGPEQADRILEATCQQEQAEKDRKRAARRKAELDAR